MVSSSTTRIVASIGYCCMTRSAIASESAFAHDGPSTTTTGTVPVSRAVSSSIVANGVTPSPSSDTMRSRVCGSTSTIATDTWIVAGCGAGHGIGLPSIGSRLPGGHQELTHCPARGLCRVDGLARARRAGREDRGRTASGIGS